MGSPPTAHIHAGTACGVTLASHMCFSALLGTLSAHMGTLSAHTGTLSAHVCFGPSAGKELPWPYDHLIEMPHKCLMEMLFDNAALQVGLPVPLKKHPYQYP